MQVFIIIHCVSKSSLFILCDYSVTYQPISIIFSSISADEIGNQMTYLSYNIPFVYEYYRIGKNKTFRMLSMQKNKNNATTKYEKKRNIRLALKMRLT